MILSRSLRFSLLFAFVCFAIQSSAKIVVVSPTELRDAVGNNGQIEDVQANFGVPPFGMSVMGRVFYFPSDGDGCLPISLKNVTLPHDMTVIMLVDRGTCSFEDKVRHVQSAGGGVAIVVNYDNSPIDRFIMTPDSSAVHNIRIPAVMIRLDNGVKLKQAASEKKEIILRMSWEVPHPDTRVEWEMWMDIEEKVSQDFLVSFADTAVALADNHLFTPHFEIWMRPASAPDFRDVSPKCLGGGRYCAPDPDGDGPLLGRNVVEEELRQICIYTTTLPCGKRDECHSLDWWRYVKVYYRTCTGARAYTRECSLDVMGQVGIDVNSVVRCYEDSFNHESGVEYALQTNKLLEQEVLLRQQNNIVSWPEVRVNNRPFRGYLTTQNVLGNICAGYSTPPALCTPSERSVIPTTPSGVAGWVMALVLSLTVGLVVVAGFFYRRHLRKELRQQMNDEVRNIIAEYMPLTDENPANKISDKAPLVSKV